MWYQTKVSEMLGIPYPIFQGPFGGGVSSPQLVAAVSNAGGLGGYGAYQLQPEEIIAIDQRIKALTDRPYNLNLWVSDADESAALPIDREAFEALRARFQPFFDVLGLPTPAAPPPPASGKFERQAEAILKVRPKVFSFIFGIPDAAILKECRRLGIKTAGAATTLDEALALEAAGIDLIVASGFEAGGHRPSFLESPEDSLIGTFALTQQIARFVQTPFVAAGGIADAKGVKAALALGASGVQIGTAFLVCEECNAPEAHKRAMLSPSARYSTLTKAFTGRLARGLRGRISETLKDGDFLPLPLQGPFLSSLRAQAVAQGKDELLTFWGGQIAPLVRAQTAGELMQTLLREMEA